jgi:hypothetical protein
MMSHTLVGFIQIIKEEKFLVSLIFKNGFVGDKMFSSKKEMFPKIPLALFWMGILIRNPELLQTLTNRKGHLDHLQS